MKHLATSACERYELYEIAPWNRKATWRSYKVIRVDGARRKSDGRLRKRNYWLKWNGERLAKGKDARVLKVKKRVHAWVTETLAEVHPPDPNRPRRPHPSRKDTPGTLVATYHEGRFELYRVDREDPSGEWVNYKLVRVDGRGRKNTWWFGWNGSRLSGSRDTDLLQGHHEEVAEAVMETLGSLTEAPK